MGASDHASSRERYRRITRGALTGFATRIATVVGALVSIPLVVRTYGVEGFAVWATLNSVVLLLAFSDLGLSHGLVNLLAKTDSDRARMPRASYVTSAFVLLTGVALCLGATFAVVFPLVDWSTVFGVRSSSAVASAGPAVVAFAACFLVNIPLSGAQSVRLGYQESAAAYMWIGLGSLLSLVLLVGVVVVRASLPLAVLATSIGPVIASLLSCIVLARARPELAPRRAHITRKAISRLLKTGALFFVCQASTAIAYQSDALVIAQVRGAAAVEQYLVPMRLFAFLPTVLQFALVPFWPAFSSALAAGDAQWASLALRRCLRVGLGVTIPVSAVLAATAGPLIHVWTGGRGPSPGLLAGLTCWTVLAAIVVPLWTLLVAANIMRPLAVMAALMAACNLALSIALTRAIGIEGAIYGTVISQVVFLVLPSTVYVRRVLGGSSTKPSSPQGRGEPPRTTLPATLP